MKKVFLVSTLFTLSLFVTAQSKTDIVIKNTCDCINNTQIDSYDYNTIVQQLSTCMAADLIKYYDDLKKELGVNEDDYSAAMEKIGEKLGERLALECPKFMELSMKMVQENDQMKEQVLNKLETASDQGPQKTFSGTIEKVKIEELTSITVHSADESLRFIWLGKFTGSENFEKNPESLKGKKVLVTYYESSVYEGSSKTYVKKKIISKLEITQ